MLFQQIPQSTRSKNAIATGALWCGVVPLSGPNPVGPRRGQSRPQALHDTQRERAGTDSEVHYGPQEKSVMHSHPDAVAVFLNDSKGRFTYPDGKTEDLNSKAGDAVYTPRQIHLPENLGDDAFDVIVIELKGKAAKLAKMEMK